MVDLEAIKKHVYQLQMYDFRGGLGLNHLLETVYFKHRQGVD